MRDVQNQHYDSRISDFNNSITGYEDFTILCNFDILDLNSKIQPDSTFPACPSRDEFKIEKVFINRQKEDLLG